MLVVEVADSSLFFDTTAKAELYAEMKIPEYWVLDLEHRQLLVFRDPAPLAAGGHAFQTHLSLKETDSISPLAAPHATIRIAELLP
jgi:Uma2 family endonuclease